MENRIDRRRCNRLLILRVVLTLLISRQFPAKAFQLSVKPLTAPPMSLYASVAVERTNARSLVDQAMELRKRRRRAEITDAAPSFVEDVDSEMLDRLNINYNLKMPLSRGEMLDIPDEELHLQIQAARRRALKSAQSANANAHRKSSKMWARQEFVDQLACHDASATEKYAIRVIPDQLPTPASRAMSSIDDCVLCESQVDKSAPVALDNDSSKSKLLMNARHRTAKKVKKQLSSEEEILLINLVHDGSRVHATKIAFENKFSRPITRTEWANRVNMTTPDLRRLVASYRGAKNKLVKANMGLVHAVVKSLYRRDIGSNAEMQLDLIQEGSIGLLRAAELFDPKRGLRFSTYATIWIKGVLSNQKIDQIVTIPTRERNKWKKISRAIKFYQSEHGPNSLLSAEDIGAMCKISKSEVEQVMDRMPKATKLLSLDYKYSEATSSSGVEESVTTLYGDNALTADADLAEMVRMKADVVAALARNLDSREARLMRLRYGFKDGRTRSIVECAEAMGISRARAQQLASGCLKKLREADEAKSLQEYLLTVA